MQTLKTLGGMAEIELSVLQRQGLARRIAEEAPLKHEIAAWGTAAPQGASDD